MNEFPLAESPVLALELASPELNVEPDELPEEEDNPDVNLEPDVLPEEDDPEVNLEPDVLPEVDAPDVNLEPDVLPEDDPEVNLEPDVLPEEEDDPRLADPLVKESAKLAPEEKHPAHNCPLPIFLIREPPTLPDPVLTTATILP